MRKFTSALSAATLAAVLGLGAAPASAQIKIQIPGFGSGGKTIDPLKEMEKKKRQEEQAKKQAAREREQKLKAVDQEVRSGLRSIPTEFGGKAKLEKQKIDRAIESYQKAKKDFTQDLEAVGENYGVVKDNLELLGVQITNAKMAHACTLARAAILEKHADTVAVGDEELKKLEQAVRTFDESKAKGWGDTVEWFRAEHKKLAENNPKIRERAEKFAVAKRKKEADKALQQAMADANRARKAIFAHLNDSADPIPAALMDALKAKADGVREKSPNAALFYDGELKYFELDNAFRNESAKARYSQVAEVLEGKKVASGRTKGKKLKVSFKTQKNWCYSTVMRWDSFTGSEKIEDLDVKGKRGNTALQNYSLYRQASKDQTIRGVCTTKPETVTLSAKLKFAGTKNGVHYTVVGWPKKEFPVFHATYMRVFPGDRCDTKAWYELWTNPVPGSLAYIGGEPFLVNSPDRAGQSWVTLTNVTGGNSVRAQKHQLTSRPQDDVAFKTQFAWKGCPGLDYAEHADSKKLAKCHKKIDKKYQKSWDRAVREKENAITVGGYKRAQAQLDRIRSKDSKDRARLCDPIEKKIKKKWQKTMDKIVDSYIDKPVEDPIQRAERMAAEDEAYPNL